MRINNSVLIWSLLGMCILGALFVYRSKKSECFSEHAVQNLETSKN